MLTRELVTVEPGAVISSVQGSVQGRASFIESVVIMVLMEYCVSSAENGRQTCKIKRSAKGTERRVKWHAVI